VSAPRYEIEHVDRFLNVPADRLSDCLSEFLTFLRLNIAQRTVVKGLADVLMLGYSGAWIGAHCW
jgi:hypothetical protein